MGNGYYGFIKIQANKTTQNRQWLLAVEETWSLRLLLFIMNASVQGNLYFIPLVPHSATLSLHYTVTAHILSRIHLKAHSTNVSCTWMRRHMATLHTWLQAWDNDLQRDFIRPFHWKDQGLLMIRLTRMMGSLIFSALVFLLVPWRACRSPWRLP